MKKAFSLLELLLIIFIFVIIGSFFNFNYKENNLEHAANRLTLYLKQVRYQALIYNQKDNEDELWHKKRWTLKFFRCNKDVGGLYYSIYSDDNKTGHPSLKESLNDPLTNKKIYSTNKCEYKNNTSKYVLLTKEFGITDIQISCNSTSSLGQISFGSNGKVYTKLSPYDNESKEYELKKRCTITLINEKDNKKRLYVEPKTGYIY